MCCDRIAAEPPRGSPTRFHKSVGLVDPPAAPAPQKSRAMAIGGSLSALIGPLRRAVSAFIPTIPWELMQRHPMINPGDCGGATVRCSLRNRAGHRQDLSGDTSRVSVTPRHTTLSLRRSGMARFSSRRNRAHDRGPPPRRNRSDLGDCRNNAQIEARAPMPQFNCGVYLRNSAPRMRQPRSRRLLAGR